MKSVEIETEYITLGQLLKLTDHIDSGGHAKAYLQQYRVDVNGEPEQRRGRKLYPNDQIKVHPSSLYQVTRSSS